MENKNPIQSVLDYIDENIDEYLSVGKLSEMANCSAPQLFRLFVSDMGVTPIKYALRRKLYYAAKELVSNDIKVIDIASSFGFESHDSFCRAFKRVYGVTPSIFRKNAYELNKFYRNNLYCISGYSIPSSLKNSGKEAKNVSEQYKNIEEFEKFGEIFGYDPNIVTMPAVKLIGVERLVSEGGPHKAYYDAYDRVFRNAPNRKYPNSENATYGFPRMSSDGETLYFAGVEVTSLDFVPDGAVSVEFAEQLCAAVGFEGGIDYDTIDYYFEKWIKCKQSKYKLDPYKLDPRFSEENAWITYSPIWEYYTPNKDCDVYEEWIYLPITLK